VNLNNLRQAAPLARLANDGGGPLHVYARLLLDSLGGEGQENTLALIGHLLRNRAAAATAFLEVQAGPVPPPFPGSRFHHSVDAGQLAQALASLGLETQEVPPSGRLEEGAPSIHRLKVRALP
jgi:hypothetical protein